MIKTSLTQKILIGFVACTIILVGVAIFSYKNNEKFIESNAWVDHTNQVISEFEQILTLTVDEETGMRGFVITGSDNYLEPYENARIKIREELTKLKQLTRDNAVQQQNLDELTKQYEKHFEFISHVIEVRKVDFERAQKLVLTGEGKRLQDEVRKLIGRSIELEKSLLVTRRQASEEDARNFNLVFAVLLLIIVVVLIAVYLIITSNLRALRKAEAETANKNWLLMGNTGLNDKMQGEKEIMGLVADIISHVTTYLNGQIGALYAMEEGRLNMVAGYAFDYNRDTALTVKPGEGLVGQVARDLKPIIFSDVPAGYVKINSGLGSISPKSILVYPFLYAGQLKGIIEVGSNNGFSELDMQLLKLVGENIGIAVNSSQSRTKLKELLEETQRQSEELQNQQEELRQLNEELEEQAQNLKQQQEELQITNEELEEQTQALEMKNREVEAAKYDIEQKTKQLEISSKYKSEFLANMSHELRTPLNSLLILSKDLSENKKKNLTPDQVESADIIYKSGRDLLSLINEVLDLSKIEAGKMTLNVEQVSVQELAESLSRDFTHYAEQKKLELKVEVAASAPQYVKTDEQRLNQILKNLLSNAVKFTERGGIKVTIAGKGREKLLREVQ